MPATPRSDPANPKKPKRLARACTLCHRDKRKCDGTDPCSNCYYGSRKCIYLNRKDEPIPAPVQPHKNLQSIAQDVDLSKPRDAHLTYRTSMGVSSHCDLATPDPLQPQFQSISFTVTPVVTADIHSRLETKKYKPPTRRSVLMKNQSRAVEGREENLSDITCYSHSHRGIPYTKDSPHIRRRN